ncbi:SGNH/GDSL hydrolase family protein [Fictibacillus iocasae]|uniref:SGNH/GDSL hydrolase family protein n=1 Tax=Fictibacillus iocasae TaxID=2715437 RepID=A0ABW2NS10_9BACL
MKKKALSFLAAGVLLLSLPVEDAAAKANNPKKTMDYVALGDSLAAGQTPYRTFDDGYPDYIADHFERSQYQMQYHNFGVSGYTSVQLRNDVLLNPSVRSELKDASHITIDIGANDLLPILKTNPAKAGVAIAGVAVNLELILTQIDQLNPNANVYVMGYYNPFPYYPVDKQEQLLPLLDALNAQIQLRAWHNGDTYIPTNEVIAKKALEFLPNPQDIHLSTEGYESIARLFVTEILKQKNK